MEEGGLGLKLGAKGCGNGKDGGMGIYYLAVCAITGIW